MLWVSVSHSVWHPTNLNEEKVVDGTMNSVINVDPAIDLLTNRTISIIIEFKTKPAIVAILEAEAKGITMTLEEAGKNVEKSHETFQQELHIFLDKNQVTYSVKHTYKTAFNGVSMELPSNEIKRLLGSSVISKIYPDKQIQLDPPITPFDEM